jgi:hypothetical protein
MESLNLIFRWHKNMMTIFSEFFLFLENAKRLSLAIAFLASRKYRR